MPSTYSTNLKIELMATGENSGTWGTVTNTNLGTAVEQAIVGYGNPDFTTDANLTITLSDSNSLQAARALVLNVTSTPSLSATRELIVPTIQKQYIVQNNTSGSQSITVKTSAGTGITVPNGRKAHLYVDGTNVIQMFDFVDINGGSIDGATVGAASASTGAFTTLTASGATTLNGAVALGDAAADLITVPGTINSNVIFTDNTYDIGASGATRPRTIYAGTSIFAPLMDATNLEVTNIKANDGTAAASIANSTGAITVSTLLNVDNLRLDGNTLSSTDSNGNVVLAPNGTGDVQLDADTVRIGDSNANATITTNGTGDLILNTNSGTNSGSITIEDGVNGNIIIAPNGTGQVQISNAALDLTTIEVTNIKAKDGTASMSIADSTGVVSITANPVLSGGTANGVLYLNASKVATSGSALTFDGTNLGIGVAGSSPLSFASTTGQKIRFYNALTGYGIGVESSEFRFVTDNSAVFTWGIGTYASPSEQMRLTSTGLGIGESNPGEKLQVVGKILATGDARIGVKKAGSDSIGAGPFFSLQNADASREWFNQLGASNTLDWWYYNGSSYTKYATLDSSGNLGLGVTPNVWGTGSSVRALQLTQGAVWGFGAANMYLGANNFFNGTDRVYLSNNTAGEYRITGNVHAWMQTAIGTANTTTITNGVSYTIITSGNQTAFGAANNNVGTSFTANASGTLSSGTVSQTISFTQAMTLDASGRLLIGGTSSPASSNIRLLLQSPNATSDGGAQFAYNGGGGGGGAIFSATGSGLVFFGYTGVVGSETYTERARIDSSGTLILRQSSNAANTSVSFNTTVQNALTLDSTGYLGVGTATPQTQVHISGAGSQTLALERTGAVVSGRFEIISGNNTNLLRAATAKPLVFEQGTGNPVMRLDTSGNLGLGVEPSAWGSTWKAFQISNRSLAQTGAGAGDLTMVFNGYFDSTDSRWEFQGAGDYAARYSITGAGVHSWHISTAAGANANDPITFTQAMTLNASGRLGVGETNPQSQLSLTEVTANTTTRSDQIRIQAESSGTTGVGFGANIYFVGERNGGTLQAMGRIGFGASTNTVSVLSSDFIVETASNGTPAERMRIDASGNLLVGKTSGSYRFDLQGAAGENATLAGFFSGTNTSRGLTIGLSAGGGAANDAYVVYNSTITGGYAGHIWQAAGTERARITSGGDLYVGTNTNPVGAGARITAVNSGAYYAGLFVNDNKDYTTIVVWNKDTTGTRYLMEFGTGSTYVAKGSITTDGTNTAYNTSSDYRLKDNQQPLTGSGAFIDALKPKTWDWKSGGKGVGFIAHEVQTVSPGSVVGEKDAVDADGNPIMQAMEYGSAEFIANIIAELQSLRARVAQLEGK